MYFPRQLRPRADGPAGRPSGSRPPRAATWALGGAGDPDATVSGPAAAVLLLLWHRVGLDDPRLTVAGSRAAADAVLAAALSAVR